MSKFRTGDRVVVESSIVRYETLYFETSQVTVGCVGVVRDEAGPYGNVSVEHGLFGHVGWVHEDGLILVDDLGLLAEERSPVRVGAEIATEAAVRALPVGALLAEDKPGRLPWLRTELGLVHDPDGTPGIDTPGRTWTFPDVRPEQTVEDALLHYGPLTVIANGVIADDEPADPVGEGTFETGPAPSGDKADLRVGTRVRLREGAQWCLSHGDLRTGHFNGAKPGNLGHVVAIPGDFHKDNIQVRSDHGYTYAVLPSGVDVVTDDAPSPGDPDRALPPNDEPDTPRFEELLGRESPFEPDMVNHPPHYTWLPNGVEVIDITELLNFNRGNAAKYLLRAGRKGDRAKEIEDLRKARFYIDREIRRMEAEL